jgi:shikimate dehydrogenase
VDAAVADIVHAPLETPLLAAARMRGLRTVDGSACSCIRQRPGFLRWFGTMRTVTPALRNRVVADLEGRSAATSSAESVLT